jgi:N-acyl-D-aspartate/D-glutamate deacylase
LTLDLLIRNGTVIDGSGMPRVVADVGVKDGRVTEIGAVTESAARVIDAGGLVVAPGIVDPHTHYDAQVTWDPLATSSCFHGVTTVVSGNCGYTMAPCRPADHEWLSKLYTMIEGVDYFALEAGVPWNWETFPEYLEALEGRLGLNYATYIGHSTIRRYVMGEAASERPARDTEIVEMQVLVREAMAAGAFGFSSSRAATQVGYHQEPIPSRLASEAELFALVGVVTEFNRGNISILPSSVLEGIDAADRELLVRLGAATRRPVVTLGDNYGSHFEAIRDLAVAAGVSLHRLQNARSYDRPLTLKRCTNFNGLPNWRELLKLPYDEMIRGMRDPSVRAGLRHDVDHPNKDPNKGQILQDVPWHTIFVQKVARPENAPLEGLSLTELAARQGKHVADAFLDLALSENLETMFRYLEARDDTDRARIRTMLESPYVLVGISDAGGHFDREDGAEYSTLFLKEWVIDRGVFSFEEAIRKITFMPAAVVGLRDRGRLAPGYAADIILFDPRRLGVPRKELVADLPGGGYRYQARPEGIIATIVNGQILVEDGKPTGALPGRVLRSATAG